jgi:hypothetical protein
MTSTLVFERKISAPTEAVFAAAADPVKRERWGTPSDTAVVIYDETDFREGGQDKFRCGSKSNPNIHGITNYLDIAINRRIVSSETITGRCRLGDAAFASRSGVCPLRGGGSCLRRAQPSQRCRHRQGLCAADAARHLVAQPQLQAAALHSLERPRLQAGDARDRQRSQSNHAQRLLDHSIEAAELVMETAVMRSQLSAFPPANGTFQAT